MFQKTFMLSHFIFDFNHNKYFILVYFLDVRKQNTDETNLHGYKLSLTSSFADINTSSGFIISEILTFKDIAIFSVALVFRV